MCPSTPTLQGGSCFGRLAERSPLTRGTGLRRESRLSFSTMPAIRRQWMFQGPRSGQVRVLRAECCQDEWAVSLSLRDRTTSFYAAEIWAEHPWKLILALSELSSTAWCPRTLAIKTSQSIVYKKLSGRVSIAVDTGLSDALLISHFPTRLDGRRVITSVRAPHLFTEAQGPECGDLRKALWTGQMVCEVIRVGASSWSRHPTSREELKLTKISSTATMSLDEARWRIDVKHVHAATVFVRTRRLLISFWTFRCTSWHQPHVSVALIFRLSRGSADRHPKRFCAAHAQESQGPDSGAWEKCWGRVRGLDESPSSERLGGWWLRRDVVGDAHPTDRKVFPTPKRAPQHDGTKDSVDLGEWRDRE